MDIKTIKDLSQKYTVQELEEYILELEQTGKSSVSDKSEVNDQMSDLLQAQEVRRIMDSGKALNEAIREFSKRVRQTIS